MYVCIILLVRMFPGLTFGIGLPIGMLFPGEDYSFYSPHSLVDYSSSCRVMASRTFPCPLWHLYRHCPCSDHVCVVTLVKLYNFLHC